MIFSLLDDVLAQLDAFIADEHRWPGDELAHLMLALSAERTVERVLGVSAANLAHSSLRSRLMRAAPHTVQTAALTFRSGNRLNRPNLNKDNIGQISTSCHANGVPTKNPLTITRLCASVFSGSHRR